MLRRKGNKRICHFDRREKSRPIHSISRKDGLIAGVNKEGQELIKNFNRIPDRSDGTSELKEGLKLYPADPCWGDSYGKYVEEFREIFFRR